MGLSHEERQSDDVRKATGRSARARAVGRRVFPVRLIFPSRRLDMHLLWLFYTLGIVAVAALGLWSFFGEGAIALVTAFALSVPAALFVIFAGRTQSENEPPQPVHSGDEMSWSRYPATTSPPSAT
jgi:hypothetical protein